MIFFAMVQTAGSGRRERREGEITIAIRNTSEPVCACAVWMHETAHSHTYAPERTVANSEVRES